MHQKVSLVLQINSVNKFKKQNKVQCWKRKIQLYKQKLGAHSYRLQKTNEVSHFSILLAFLVHGYLGQV